MSLAHAMLAGPRYGPKVRIGNWAEDESRFALAAKDYEVRRERGELLHLRKAAERAFQTQRVPRSFAPDGVVRYGMHLQLACGDGDGDGGRRVLACNINSAVRPGHVRVTATHQAEAQARNVFVLHPAAVADGGAGGRDGDGGVVRYGDRVRVWSNPILTADPATRVVGVPYQLHSQRANNVLGAGRKGWQEATMTQVTASPDSEWVIMPTGDVPVGAGGGVAGGDGGALEGDPIHAGQSFQLVHAMTNQALAWDVGATLSTDYGTELEGHVHSYKRAAHTSMSHKGELPLAVAQAQNRWRFVTAVDGSEEEEGCVGGLKPLTLEGVVDKARAALTTACGLHGLRSFSLSLSALDGRGSGFVPVDSVKRSLVEHGVLLQLAEVDMLMGGYASGPCVNTHDLVAALRGGDWPRGRADMVWQAYDHLQATGVGRGAAALGHTARTTTPTTALASTGGGGVLTVSDVKAAYDAKWDPRVVAGELTPVEAAAEFQRQWPAHAHPASPVTLDDFVTYYADVSACVGDDATFVTMVANVWHVPGQGCWRAKKGKRVLVTFHKGTSTEVVIPGAEDIADDDFTALASALKRMGLGGIARVKVLALVEAE